MPHDAPVDFYEILQISPNADPDMVHRVYRLLAQRFHPDNQQTGDATKFRVLHEAYRVLSEPEKRAQYDVTYQKQRQDRWRLAAESRSDTDVESEQMLRLTILEVLYTKRRMEPNEPGIFDRDLEMLIGRPREHLEFAFWYLIARSLVSRGEHSRLQITVAGVDYLEEHFGSVVQRRRLPRVGEAA
jgi:curved DNA-binding protein CbpA